MDTVRQEYLVRRNVVEHGEKVVAEYLDKEYYPIWANSVERIPADTEEQYNGLDLTALSGTTQLSIDEKASVLWAGKVLCTFSQEISFINAGGHEMDGWLLDFNSVSDYLLYVWIDDCRRTPLKDPDDIIDATVALVAKKDLWHYLKEEGFSSTQLRDTARWMRNNSVKETTIHGHRLTCRLDRQEKAANILIPRRMLIEMAVHACRITRNGITDLTWKR